MDSWSWLHGNGMLRHVAVSYWPERRAGIPDDWEIWKTTKSTADTYAELSDYAVAKEWNLDTIVVQDDVRILEYPDVNADLVVYGQRNNHVCPRAFAATPRMWRWLARRWRGQQICQAWEPLVTSHGIVLDVTTHG